MKKAYVRFDSYIKNGENIVIKTTRKEAKKLCHDFALWFAGQEKSRVSWIKPKFSKHKIKITLSYDEIIRMLNPMCFRMEKFRRLGPNLFRYDLNANN